MESGIALLVTAIFKTEDEKLELEENLEKLKTILKKSEAEAISSSLDTFIEECESLQPFPEKMKSNSIHDGKYRMEFNIPYSSEAELLNFNAKWNRARNLSQLSVGEMLTKSVLLCIASIHRVAMERETALRAADVSKPKLKSITRTLSACGVIKEYIYDRSPRKVISVVFQTGEEKLELEENLAKLRKILKKSQAEAISVALDAFIEKYEICHHPQRKRASQLMLVNTERF